MQAWMEGYESDIEYTAGYYREQEPDFLNLCLVAQGIQPIDIESEFTYCELGCGLGLTSIIIAANYPKGKFYAVDFNPSHIARARSLAKQAGINNIIFLEKSFADINEDSSLIPECDFIVLHGIFTWVSDENRQHIIDICSKKLRSGGLVYNSYNAKPGWSLGEPIQKMMIAAGKMVNGGSLKRFNFAKDFVKEFSKLDSRFFAINPNLIEHRLKSLDSGDKNYLVHEYFNEGWRAFYFTEIADYLSLAKLEFVGDANLTSSYNMSLLPEKARNFLLKMEDKIARELYKDVLFNTMFRKDIYLRGIINNLNINQQKELFYKIKWSLMKLSDEVKKGVFKFNSAAGKVDGRPDIYNKILASLEIDSMDFWQLSKIVKSGPKELTQALLFLYQDQIISPIRSIESNLTVMRLNDVLSKKNLNSQSANYIVLPKFKTSLPLGMVDCLFYQLYKEADGKLTTLDLIESATQQLESRELFLLHEGQELKGRAMQERLSILIKEWMSNTLPVLIRGGALALS